MLQGLYVLAVVSLLCFLTIKQASMTVWSIVYAILALLVFQYSSPSFFLSAGLVMMAGVVIVLTIKPWRRQLITRHLFRFMARAMPAMSQTERTALEAGTVSFEGELFSGDPDFNALLDAPVTKLTAEEQAFLDGPTNELCRMIDDWDITHNRTDLSPETWAFIKTNGFLGMIIPKEYGGLGFSATAQMSILVTLYGRSITAATMISVPNSLGPAELLLKYGTDDQKKYYLPRLANGTEIPCFALTGPTAGSDAASIPDKGVVCMQSVDGKDTLGMRLTWNKRYITLCPMATVIGLAFRLVDPDNLLGKGHDIGISCALIPANTPGVIRGRRHFPLNIPFLNGPTQGNDVFVSLDCLIGGVAMAGHGWRMLMDCLSAGRAIGLPSSASGGAQAAALGSGAYARVRQQFNQPIANFEGIEEPLARIAGQTYIIDAGLTMAASAIDQGEKPSVAGAILKYHTTDRFRHIIMDAMDIHGGKAICLGPNNYLGRGYQGSPISITVEGANILSRSLIIFGQGAIRCHPYVFQEMESLKNKDIQAFDDVFFGHISFFLSNTLRSMVFALTGARFTPTPTKNGRRYYQQIRRYSANLAFLADFSMILLGGELKRKEALSARLGDLLSALYMASAVLKRFYADSEPAADLPLVHWSCQQLFHECEEAIDGVISNFPSRWAQILLKIIVKPWGSKRWKPSDKLGHQLAQLLTKPSESRDRLTRFAFREAVKTCPLGRLEEVFQQVSLIEPLEKKVKHAVKKGQLTALTRPMQLEEAVMQGILTKDEAIRLQQVDLARERIIAVDDFSHDELARAPMTATERFGVDVCPVA